uniref:Uncharacterized protein n=1 Tax=Melopsittacus undulatus TaxID=13146 RepID=A0A8C6JWM5_MELUD
MGKEPEGQPPPGCQDTAADSPPSTVPVRRGWDIHGAATAIQAWWHRAITCRREERRLRLLAQYVRQEKAIVLLQSCARMRQARVRYQRCREAARTIQTHWRRRGKRQHGGTEGCDLSIEVILG